MPCPYCNSGDWEVRATLFHEIIDNGQLWQHQECICRECSNLFVTKQLFVEDESCYECITMEEHDDDYSDWMV